MKNMDPVARVHHLQSERRQEQHAVSEEREDKDPDTKRTYPPDAMEQESTGDAGGEGQLVVQCHIQFPLLMERS